MFVSTLLFLFLGIPSGLLSGILGLLGCGIPYRVASLLCCGVPCRVASLLCCGVPCEVASLLCCSIPCGLLLYFVVVYFVELLLYFVVVLFFTLQERSSFLDLEGYVLFFPMVLKIIEVIRLEASIFLN